MRSRKRPDETVNRRFFPSCFNFFFNFEDIVVIVNYKYNLSCLLVEGRGSRVTSRGSWVNGRGSRVTSRGSRVTSRGSRVNGRGSKNPPQLFLNVVKSKFRVYSSFRCLLYFYVNT